MEGSALIIAVYLHDHYGTCLLGSRCQCLMPGNKWQGMDCKNWVPCGCKTMEELLVWQKKLRDANNQAI